MALMATATMANPRGQRDVSLVFMGRCRLKGKSYTGLRCVVYVISRTAVEICKGENDVRTDWMSRLVYVASDGRLTLERSRARVSDPVDAFTLQR